MQETALPPLAIPVTVNLPLVTADFMLVALLIAFPALAHWLPAALKM